MVIVGVVAGAKVATMCVFPAYVQLLGLMVMTD